jgi:hypothetical protein
MNRTSNNRVALNKPFVITSTDNLALNLLRRTNKNFLKMCGGNLKTDYL